MPLAVAGLAHNLRLSATTAEMIWLENICEIMGDKLMMVCNNKSNVIAFR